MDDEQFLLKINGRPKEGELRISVGLVTNYADVYRFLQFVQNFVENGLTLPEMLVRKVSNVLIRPLFVRYLPRDREKKAVVKNVRYDTSTPHTCILKKHEA